MQIKRSRYILLCILVLVVSCKLPKEQQIVYVAATPWVVDLVFLPKSTPIPTVTPAYTQTSIRIVTSTATPSSAPTSTYTSTPTETSTSTPTLTTTPTLTPTNTPTETSTPIPPPVFSRGDLHLHTRCSDGTNGYEDVAERALQLGYDFIAITDHRYSGMGYCSSSDGRCDDALCDRIIQKCRKEERLHCIPGMEVTSTSQHLLAIGIQTGIDDRLPMQTQIDDIHWQGGLAILAHPGLFGAGNAQGIDIFGLDGMECRSNFFSNLTQPFLDLLLVSGLPCLYNSDAHNVDSMGIHTTCKGKINNLEDLKAALIERRCWDGTINY